LQPFQPSGVFQLSDGFRICVQINQKMSFSVALENFGQFQTEVLFPAVQIKTATDHELIEAVKCGDETAFDEVVNRYRQPITNYIFRILNDYEEAVDLSQETFVRVYFAIERYHTEYAFSTYIYRIATNLAISEIRKRKRRKLLSLTGLFQSDDDDKEFDIPDAKNLQDIDLIEFEQKASVSRAIAALPEKYRIPIVLRDIEERNYDQVAEVLGLSLGTTKSRISRGRAMLREKLKANFEFENE
jgi:RNA polymerase sigma-70 factor, ECF subfamily